MRWTIPGPGARVLLLAGALLSAHAATGHAADVAAAGDSAADQAFIESLAERYGDRPVDVGRVARLLGASASGLEEALKTLEFLQMRVAPHDGGTSGPALASRFDDLAGSVERFLTSTSRLGERPDSPHLLFVVMARGQRACVELDGYLSKLRESGLGDGDRVTTRGAVEACSRFREIVFQPRVEGVVLGALSDDERAVPVETGHRGPTTRND